MVRQKRLTPLSDAEKVGKGRDPVFEFLWKVVDPNEVLPLQAEEGSYCRFGLRTSQ